MVKPFTACDLGNISCRGLSLEIGWRISWRGILLGEIKYAKIVSINLLTHIDGAIFYGYRYMKKNRFQCMYRGLVENANPGASPGV